MGDDARKVKVTVVVEAVFRLRLLDLSDEKPGRCGRPETPFQVLYAERVLIESMNGMKPM